MLALSVGLCDGWICRMIKDVVARPRPFLTLTDVHCLIGKGGSFSMPSSHAANWFAATMIAAVYYRRSLWFMVPLALLVSYSRVYNGVHYPGDVLAGALLGAGFAGAVLWVTDSFWQFVGQKWFPLWWARMPSLIAARIRPEPSEEEAEPVFAPRRTPEPTAKAGRGVLTAPNPIRELQSGAVGTPRPTSQRFESPHETTDKQWLRLGYIVTGALLVARLAYIASGTIQLSEDESYQWLWSKHLALSYYSKPPLIAYTQFLGTSIFGDTAFGIRFFSPVIAALLSVIVLRFFAKAVNARAGFFLLLITTATPLLSAGAILMTVDPLSVLFWTAAMVCGWRAVQPNASIHYWLWTGLWMGLGFLSKFSYQIVSWMLFFILWVPARKSLRSPGPYFALLINAMCLLPVLIWNYQHGWITVQHVAQNAGADTQWHWENLYKYPFRFVTAEFGLLNPIFFVAMVWASVAMWRHNRHNSLLLYFFAMGAPVFLLNLALSFHSSVLPNWIAPSVIPLFCLMIAYWDTRWRLGATQIKPWVAAGLIFGFATSLLFHNTDITKKLTGGYLPVNTDPLHRVRGWSDVAKTAGEARNELANEGKPVFIIAEHYGLVGQISFYLPEAKAAVTQTPLVYYKSTSVPKNQFFYWPGYGGRKGENAVYVRELDRKDPKPRPAPQSLVEEFESVTDMGVRNVLYHGQLLRPLQFFACRNLK